MGSSHPRCGSNEVTKRRVKGDRFSEGDGEVPSTIIPECVDFLLLRNVSLDKAITEMPSEGCMSGDCLNTSVSDDAKGNMSDDCFDTYVRDEAITTSEKLKADTKPITLVEEAEFQQYLQVLAIAQGHDVPMILDTNIDTKGLRAENKLAETSVASCSGQREVVEPSRAADFPKKRRHQRKSARSNG